MSPDTPAGWLDARTLRRLDLRMAAALQATDPDVLAERVQRMRAAGLDPDDVGWRFEGERLRAYHGDAVLVDMSIAEFCDLVTAPVDPLEADPVLALWIPEEETHD